MSRKPTAPLPWYRRTGVWIALGLVVATAVAYRPVWDNGFVENYDDTTYITKNPHVLAGLTWRGAWWALTTGSQSNWHPLTWLSLQLDVTLFGPGARGFHFTNLLFHVGATVVLFFALARMTGAVWPAAFAAALFALHPLHVESVAWAAERKDVLSAFLGVATLWAYVRYVERPAPGRYLATAGVYALGLLAKPMLVTLPFVLLLLDYWPLRRFAEPLLRADAVPGEGEPLRPACPRYRAGWLLVEKVPLLVLAAASSVVTFLVQREGGAMESLEWVPLWARLENALVVAVAYIGKMAWPLHLAIFYPHPGILLPAWKAVAAGLLLAGATGLAVWGGRRHPYLPVGWFWYVGMLVPVIGVVQVGSQAMADRYTYLPSVGLGVLAAWGAAELAARRGVPGAVLALAAGGVLAGCAAATWVQAGTWKDAATVWAHARDAVEGNYLAYHNFGLELDHQGRLEDAMAYYEKALALKPDYFEARYNLGFALLRLGRMDDAARNFRMALAIDPRAPEANTNLGIVLAEQGKFEEAVARFDRALKSRPDLAAIYIDRGLAFERMGRLADAYRDYTDGLKLMAEQDAEEAGLPVPAGMKADRPLAHRNLGWLLVRMGRLAEAEGQLTEAVRLRPKDPDMAALLGEVLFLEGRPADAAAWARRALGLRPGVGRRYYELGLALAGQGQATAARRCFEVGRRLDPNWPRGASQFAWRLATAASPGAGDGLLAVYLARQSTEATGEQDPDSLDTLAAAYARAGRFGEARSAAGKAIELAAAQGHTDWVPSLRARLRLDEGGVAYRAPSGRAGTWE